MDYLLLVTLSEKMSMAAKIEMECIDFLQFQDSLQKMRQMDDKIVYILNSILPTDSFKERFDPENQCKNLFQQIYTGHAQREIAIKRCIDVTRERVRNLKSQRDAGQENNVKLLKDLKKEQNKLRLLESELSVEDVVKKRTLSVYHEKCRGYYKPPDLDSSNSVR